MPAHSMIVAGMTALERIAYTGWDVAENGCWIWRGTIRPDRYPQICIRKKFYIVTRLILGLGSRKDDPRVAMHLCDNPPCVNPAHLRAGTHHANTMDGVIKHRIASGEEHAWSKLTAKQVTEIRTAVREGRTHTAVAQQYGVVRATVSLIVANKTWRHIDMSKTKTVTVNPDQV